MVYRLVRRYSAALGFEIGAHALRGTAATNALDHQADIAKVQEWLGHVNIATTPLLRSPQNPARGQPDVQGGLSISNAGNVAGDSEGTASTV
jgi:integrase